MAEPQPTASIDPPDSVGIQRQRARELARRFRVPFVVPAQALAILDAQTCHRLKAVPLERLDGQVVVGLLDPAQDQGLAFISRAVGVEPRMVIVAECDFDLVVGRLPGGRHLRATTEQTPPDQLGKILIDMGAIDARGLKHALAVQERTGDRLGTLLVIHGIASAEHVAQAIARQMQLTIVRRSDLVQEQEVEELLPEATCRRHRLLPLSIKRHRLRVAMVDPGDQSAIAALRKATNLPLDPVVATETDIVEMMRELHRERQTSISVYGLLNRRPDESAHVVLDGRQKIVGIGSVFTLCALLFWQPVPVGIVLLTLSSLFYTFFAVFKIRAIVASLDHDPGLWVSDEEAAAIAERDLPVYTILVPLYKETEVLPRLIKGLGGLDYPDSKLDVKLLLEEDDVETVAAAYAMDLPAFVDIVVTPDSHPKTKPKSCNYGLLYARGEYTVIFDAEDVPEKNQLRKAVAAFRKAPPKVVCLQGMLNYYNREQNLLTKWFTGEYSGWFDMLVPGLDCLKLPIPLGGTSNHFVTDVLVELGAWDPFNVTEDADLGIRLFNAGYSTASINSTTYEEANSETFNWIRQRSRWVKGYIQTWLVHMRHPLRLIEGVGLRNFLGFQLVIAGTFFVFLLNPLYWAMMLLWVLTGAHVVRDLLPVPMYYISAASFIVGNFVFIYINALAAMRRRYWNLLTAALLSPLYWGLMSIAAWRGLLQLIWAPSYWEKTEHGLDGHDEDAEEAA
jgi:cellulose synthase/poly-beta-1,6-N-acetylglucosamine synthase-like glycosyltransferase